MEKRDILASYAYHYLGDWSMIAQALKRQEPPFICQIRESYVTIFDSQYPAALRQLRFPPWLLFWQGNLALLQQPGLTIVGSRQMSGYGEQTTRLIATRLAQRFTLVSGLALGVDAAVHESAIVCGGSTIGVIGSGLATHYPRQNERLYRQMAQNHLILSEYPSYVGVRREHFPWRNRILAALGQALIVTQARVKSGTMLTVSEALSLGRDVWCVPYPFADESGQGCDLLISQGALILHDPDQLADLKPAAGKPVGMG